jgi:hypothetical protein
MPDLSQPPRGVTVSRSLISGIDIAYRRINPVAYLSPDYGRGFRSGASTAANGRAENLIRL